MEVLKLSWDQVKPIWDGELWPGRDSEPVTSMMYLGGYDMEYKNLDATFLGIVVDDEIVGVNSYVPTEPHEFRSRGLWVRPDKRGKGYANKLLQATIMDAVEEGGRYLWTMPREDALPAYKSVGFIRTSGWFNADWRRNCYALKSLWPIERIQAFATQIKAGRKVFYVRKMSVVEEKMTTEEARLMMRELADDEQGRWG